MKTDFQLGQDAARAGQPRNSNPHICGKTKLGYDRLSDAEAGADWYAGFDFSQPARQSTPAEIAAARSMDITQFGKRRARNWRSR